MSNENPTPDMSIEKQLEMVTNALEHTRSARDQYMREYYDANRENKRLKNEVSYLESRITDLKHELNGQKPH